MDALATIPVMALMPTRAIAPVLITAYVCVGTLQHANLRWTFGPFGRVIVSPAYHRLARVTNPSAPIGDPMSSRTGSALVSLARTS